MNHCGDIIERLEDVVLANLLQASSSLPESLPTKIEIRCNFQTVVRTLWDPIDFQAFLSNATLFYTALLRE